MKLHQTSISFIIACMVGTLSIGRLAAFYSSKSTDKTETIQLLEKEIGFLQETKNRPDLIYKVLHAAYPRVPEQKMRHYALLINDLSGQFNVNWSMIAATIWVESRFDPTLKSPKEAKGLMQLLEKTAAEQALKMGIKYDPDKTVWDDVTNLSLGVRYLGEGYKKEGDYQKTAFYYLAGPHWRKTIRKNHRVREYLHGYASDVLCEEGRLVAMYSEISGSHRKSRASE